MYVLKMHISDSRVILRLLLIAFKNCVCSIHNKFTLCLVGNVLLKVSGNLQNSVFYQFALQNPTNADFPSKPNNMLDLGLGSPVSKSSDFGCLRKCFILLHCLAVNTLWTKCHSHSYYLFVQMKKKQKKNRVNNCEEKYPGSLYTIVQTDSGAQLLYLFCNICPAVALCHVSIKNAMFSVSVEDGAITNAALCN